MAGYRRRKSVQYHSTGYTVRPNLVCYRFNKTTKTTTLAAVCVFTLRGYRQKRRAVPFVPYIPLLRPARHSFPFEHRAFNFRDREFFKFNIYALPETKYASVG